MCTSRYSVKQTGFSVPQVPGLYKIHDAGMTLTQDCSALLIDSTQLDIIIALVNIVLASG